MTPEPPDDYEDLLCGADGLLALVKLFRRVARGAARGEGMARNLLAWLLDDLEEALGEAKAVLSGGRQEAGRPHPRGDYLSFLCGSHGLLARLVLLRAIARAAAAGEKAAALALAELLPDLEELLGEVEGALTRRN
jgi:hypothetical protein